VSGQRDPQPEPPVRKVSELPEWPSDDYEPEFPHAMLQQIGPKRWQIQLNVNDEFTARWLAHWVSKRPNAGRGNFWEAFGEWLDSRR
jgi:hypothetical protein